MPKPIPHAVDIPGIADCIPGRPHSGGCYIGKYTCTNLRNVSPLMPRRMQDTPEMLAAAHLTRWHDPHPRPLHGRTSLTLYGDE